MLSSGLQGHLHTCGTHTCGAHTCTQANTHIKGLSGTCHSCHLTSRQYSPLLLEAVPSSPGTTPHQGNPSLHCLAQDDTTPGKPLTSPSWSWTSLRFSWPLVPSVTWLHLCLCDLPQLPMVKVMYPRCLWHPEWPTMPLSPQLQNSFLTPQSPMTSEQGHLFQCLHLAWSCSILLSAEPPSCSHLHLIAAVTPDHSAHPQGYSADRCAAQPVWLQLLPLPSD